LPLPSGTRIGGYEILSLLGAGGMGEVYRARDARLGRDVAIKVLSPQIAADADALMRFEREARALASLNHPNIAAIYGVEDTAAHPALILELVDGETLADRIARGPVPVDQAIEYAKQIADALDVAHEAGIVHRDLKPGNIKITDDGRIKVLDFGLAKAVAAAAGESVDVDPSNSPTVALYGTRHGVILGTAAYMSPEQARGKRIDKRTDIWAFGCVLFEMLTGTRAFTGETASDVIAAIIERAPDLARLPASTPRHVRRVIERCLEKDPKRRARDIADVRAELDLRDTTVVSPPRRRWPALVGAVVMLIAAAAGLAAWRWRPAAPASPALIEFTVNAPDGHALASQAALSPDGTQIAFVARDERQVPSIWLRSIDNATSRRVDGTEGVGNAPEGSPDSRALAFFVAGVWKRVNVAGGPPVTIVADVPGNLGASWGANDVLLLATANRTSLSRVAIAGGPLQQATTLDTEKENSHRWPRLLPDGRHFLFTVRSDSPERLGIKLGALDSRDTRMLVNVASPGIYVEPGWLLYVTPDKVLMAHRLEPGSWTIQGTPLQIAGPVAYNGPSFSAAFDASLDGRVIAYQPAPRGDATLEWFDRSGKPLGRVGAERSYSGVRLSPDGRLAMVEIPDPQIGTRDLWLADTARATMTRFTSHPATDWRPVFSQDGSAVVFASDRAGASTLFRAPLDGTGGETVLYRHDGGGGAFSWSWSSDGRYVLASADDRQGRPVELLLVPVAGGAPASLPNPQGIPFLMARLSPRGDYVAFVNRTQGSQDVIVMSVRDGQRVRVSTDGGTNPVWGPDGELYFHNRGAIMRTIMNGMTQTGKPESVFRPCESLNRTFVTFGSESGFDITADGSRFLVICESEGVRPSATNVIVNWQSKLR
jgi:Tol biopolymer transport system component